MVRLYEEFLPQYLRNGENIKKHGRIINYENKYIEEMFETIADLLRLSLPILLEYDADENKLQLNVSSDDSFIHNIQVTLERENNITTILDQEYEEQVSVLETITEQLQSEDIIQCTVTLENEKQTNKILTYNEEQWTEETHNEKLDIIGAILNILRKTDETDQDYLKRLEYFIQNYDNTELVHLMYKTITNHTIEEEYTLSNMKTRTTSLPSYLYNLRGQNISTLIARNNNINTRDLQTVIDRYGMITRQYIIQHLATTSILYAEPYMSKPDFPGQQMYCNRAGISLAVRSNYNNKNDYLRYATVTLEMNGRSNEVMLESVDDVYNFVGLYGLYGTPRLSVIYEGEYEQRGCSEMIQLPRIEQNASLDLADWEYGEWNNTSVTVTVAPTSSGINGPLDTGRGYLVATHIAELGVVDKENYGIELNLENVQNYQSILLCKDISVFEDGSMLPSDDFVTISPYQVFESDKENVDVFFDIVDGFLYVYLDDGEEEVLTGYTADFSEYDGSLYLVFYSRSSQSLIVNGLNVGEAHSVPTIPASSITVNTDYTAYYGDTILVNGSLLNADTSTGVTGATINLYDGQSLITTATTDSNGDFTFSLQANNWNMNGKQYTLSYDGDSGTYRPSSNNFTVHLQRHTTTMSIADLTGYIDDTVDIIVEVTDENDNPVTEGTVTITLEEEEE